MAVYTKLSQSDIATFIAEFMENTLASFEEAADGMENTTYFITVGKGGEFQTFVLTVVEALEAEQLPFIVDFITALNEQGLPIPGPVRDKKGKAVRYLKDKPALMVPKVYGAHQSQVNEKQCFAIGEVLGQMHAIGLKWDAGPVNPRDFAWCHAQLNRFRDNLSEADTKLLNNALEVFQQLHHLPSSLPRGVIHGDVFRDNVLFENNKVVAVIDFFMACYDYLLLDLAITVNDWCSTSDGGLDETLYRALLNGYQQQRSLSEDEQKHWPLFLQFSAFRFWVGRLAYEYDGLNNPEKASTVYRDILTKRLMLGSCSSGKAD